MERHEHAERGSRPHSECAVRATRRDSPGAILQRGGKKQHPSATIFWLVSETRLAKRYFVSGMVQGVGFRIFTQRAAEKLSIGGFVRNLWDGRVEVFAIGTPEQHKELRRQLERGPMGSDVTEVVAEPAAVEARYDGGFVINPSA